MKKEYAQAIYILMTKFHWPLSEIQDMAISTFVEIQKLIEWEAKEMERSRK